MLRLALVVCAAASVLAAGCVQPASTQCGKTGPVCPDGWVCIDDLSACIDPTTTKCGDGQEDAPEEDCDDGNFKNGDTCNWNCKEPTCGDGLVGLDASGTKEECDEGANGQAKETSTCNSDCTIARCGDTQKNVAAGEQCDTGTFCDADDPKACTSDDDCEGIGDGKCAPRLQACCTADCRSPSCGNGVVDPACSDPTISGSPVADAEVCDNGKQCANGAKCATNADCTDQSNCEMRNGFGCKTTCDSKEECGDGVPNNYPHRMQALHRKQMTVNGKLEVVEVNEWITASEVCDPDPGDTTDGDGCSSDCLSAEQCGDGWLNPVKSTEGENPVPGEVCDDGNQANNDGCSSDCQSSERCGDGNKDGGEDCDPGMHCEADPTIKCDCPDLASLLGTSLLQFGCINAEQCAGFTDNPRCLPLHDFTPGKLCRKDCKEIRCGNGIEDPLEECDDLDTTAAGADNEDDCHTDCTKNTCGDGIVNHEGVRFPGINVQACDALELGEEANGTCDPDCTLLVCGDGKINFLEGEFCDSGPGTMGPLPAPPEGRTLPHEGDPGTVETDRCNIDCRFPVCGDGTVNKSAGEICDDRNTENDDGCSADCKSTEVCGNGRVDVNVTRITLANGEVFKLPSGEPYKGAEICDLGGLCADGLTPCTMKVGDCGGELGTCQPKEGVGCSADCYTKEVCGDKKLTPYLHTLTNTAGVATTWPAETCDDGNLRFSDGCDAECELEPGWACPTLGEPCEETCGDGLIVGGESCDEGTGPVTAGCNVCAEADGWACPATTVVGQVPKVGGVCKTVCGDRLIRGAENCDDGNENAKDGCDSSCKKEAGWVCPTGNSGGTCVSTCGDSLVVGTEECDDGRNNLGVTASGDGCDSTCRIETGFGCPTTNGIPAGGLCAAVCGDGLVRGAETCDEGTNTPSGGCTSCQKLAGWTCPTAPGGLCTATCGDGVVTGGETCDDGDQIAGDGCSGTCKGEGGWTCPPTGGDCAPTCGDGVLRGNETCDEGTSPASGGCTACVKAAGWSCTPVGTTCTTICGDGLTVGAEQCDAGAENSNFGDCLRSCVRASCSDAFVHSITAVVGGPIETDLNCGTGNGATGPTACPKCAATKHCVLDSDCLTNFCNPLGNTCAVPVRVADQVRMHVNGAATLVFDASFLLANDAHTNPDTFSVGNATCGSVAYDGTAGTITFDRTGGTPCEAPATTPATLYTSTFQYTVCPPAPNHTNPSLCSAPTTVTVVINRDPVLAFTAACVAVGTASTSVNVLSAFTDPDTNGLAAATIGPTSAHAGVAAVNGSVVTWTPTDPKVPGDYNVAVHACDDVSNAPFPARGCADGTWTVRWSEAPHLVSISDSAAYPIFVDEAKSLPAYTGDDRIITDEPTAEVTVTVAKFANGPFAETASDAGRGTCTLVDPSDALGDESVDYAAPALPLSDSCFVQVCEVCSGIQICSVTRIPFKVIEAPVAEDDAVQALSGPTATGVFERAVLLANDENVDPSSFLVLNDGDTVCGGLITGTPSLTYTGAVGATGGCLDTDSFTYEVCSADIPTRCVTATVTIAIGRFPDAVEDTVTTNEDTAIVIDADTLLDNDTDPDADPLTILSVESPTNGTVSLVGTTITFTPTPADFNGTAGFLYTIGDGTGLTDQTAVTVNVTPVNDPPIITSGVTATIAENAVISTVVYTATASDVDTVGGDTITWTLAGPDAASFDIAANGQLTLKAPANFEAKSVYTVSVVATDTGPASVSRSVTVNITNVNDAPTVTSSATGSVAENASPTTVVYTATASDPDAGDSIAWTLSGTDAASFAIAANGSVTLIASANFELKPSYSINVVATDSGLLTATRAVTINITDVNDAPVAVADSASTNEDTPVAITAATLLSNDTDADLPANTLSVIGVGGPVNGSVSLNGTTVTFTPTTEFGGAASFTYTISDGAGGLSTATVTVNVAAVNDNPAITSATTASVAEGATAVLTATATDVDLPAQTLTFTIVGGADQARFGITSGGSLTFNAAPDFETPLDAGANNVYDVTVQVSDGAGGTATSAIAVTVTNVNDAPTITSGAATSVAENTTAVLTVTATDADAPAQTLTFTISGGADAAKFSITSGGVLTFVVAPNFEAPADAGADNIYNVTIQVSDGTTATTQAITVTVTNANEAPAITSNGGDSTAAVNASENQTAVTDVDASDPDAAATLTYSKVGGADQALFVINASTGVLAFLVAPDFDVPTDAGGNNVYDVTVQVSDGSLTDTQAIAVTVTAVSDPPVITSNGGGASASISIAENTTAVTDVDATDPNAGDTLTYSLSGGADQALFTINASTGVLAFLVARNFESPSDAGTNNVYDVTVQVSDGGNTDTQAIAVTITDANDAPAITSNGGGASGSVSISENGTAVTDVDASDPDAGATLTYAISGGADSAKFAIDPSTGVLTFAVAPNFESPTDAGANNVYDVTVQVSDGTNTDTQTIAVTVTNVNEAPAITSNGGGASASVSRAENGTAVTTVVAGDPEGGSITYAINGGVDAGAFAIDSSTGALTFLVVMTPNFEAPGDTGANNVYDVIVEATDGTFTDSQTIAVTVTDANDAPVITSGASASVAENTGAVQTVTSTDEDLPAQTVTYAKTGGDDAAWFSVNASTGALTFLAPPDFEDPSDFDANNVYDVEVTASDTGSPTGTDIQTITVTVTNANEAPVITSKGGGPLAAYMIGSVSVAENGTAVTTVTATDQDAGATLTYSITGGADSAKFAINSSSGVLTFVAAPSFEPPGDVGANNLYDVTVQVSDGTNTDTQVLEVTLTDVNEAPSIVSDGGGASASISIPENGTAVTTVTASDPDAGASLAFTILGGADAAKFAINGTSGVLTFVSAPDFETPTDTGTNNVYDVTVQVSDGTNTDTQAIAVTVTNVNEAPVITSNGGGASASISIAENGTAVTTVTASDPEAASLTYSISGGVDAAKFAINGTTGVLVFLAAPDFETPTDTGGDNVYDLTVEVSDGTNTDTQTIAVTVTDVVE